jgi:serine phosphatase RsbU (regulator of sigma subunit)
VSSVVRDPKRLAAVRATGLLDTEPEPQFDQYARLAALTTSTSQAFVSIVDDRHTYWKSTIGFGDLTVADRQYPVQGTACHILIATDHPLIVEDVAHDPRIRDLAMVERWSMGALAGHPVHGPDGEVLGGLWVMDSAARTWSETEVLVLSTLAQAISAEVALREALSRANRHVRLLQAAGKVSSDLAQTLQRSLLPPLIPKMPGMEAAASFIPAAGGVIVTGDFYDLFPTGGSRWCVVLGDVSGHGVPAAQITALARYTIRADALNTLSPSRVLEQLNQALLTQRSPDERFLTAACAILQPVKGAFTGLLTTAGHPSVLLLRADGSVEPLRTSGTLLGLFEDADLGQDRFTLRPGEALVMYSDGVTEAHIPSDWDLFGEGRLIELLSKSAHLEAEALVKRISDAALNHSHGHMIDDMAILALRVPPTDDTSDQAGSTELGHISRRPS